MASSLTVRQGWKAHRYDKSTVTSPVVVTLSREILLLEIRGQRVLPVTRGIIGNINMYPSTSKTILRHCLFLRTPVIILNVMYMYLLRVCLSTFSICCCTIPVR